MLPAVCPSGRPRRTVLAVPVITSIPEGKDEGKSEDAAKSVKKPQQSPEQNRTTLYRAQVTQDQIQSYVRDVLEGGEKETSPPVLSASKEYKRKFLRLTTNKQRSHSRISKLRRSARSLRVLSSTVPVKLDSSPPLAKTILQEIKSSDSVKIKSPSVCADVLRSALLGNAAIEARKKDFAALKSDRKIKKRPSFRLKKKLRALDGVDEKSYPDSPSSSEDNAVSTNTYALARPSLLQKRKKRLERARSLRGNEKVACATRGSCFVFKHPEATYVVTKVPKRDEGSDASTSSNDSPRSIWWKKAFDLRERASRAMTESRRSSDWWSCPLEDPFADEKRAPPTPPSRWDPDVSAVFAAVSRIAARRPRLSSQSASHETRRLRRSWTPQREPRDRGLGFRDHPCSPPELLCSVDCGGMMLEDRGTSPLPQPAIKDKAVGAASETRGTSPLMPLYTIDQGNSAEELWKDPQSRNIENAMKVIAKVKEAHVPEEISVYNASGIQRFPESYPSSPPQQPPPDKGLLVFDKDGMAKPKNDVEWSGHSIVLEDDKKCTDALLACKQFWPSPNPFEVLESSFPTTVDLYDVGMEMDEDDDDSNFTLGEVCDSNTPITLSNTQCEGDASSNTLSRCTVSTHQNKPSSGVVNEENAPSDNEDTENAKENQEDPKTGAKGIKKRLFGNMWLRTSWQLPQEKFLAAKESFEEIPQWQAIPGAPENRGKSVSLKKHTSHSSGPSNVTVSRRPRRLHVTGCPGACGGNKRHGGCVLRKHTY